MDNLLLRIVHVILNAYGSQNPPRLSQSIAKSNHAALVLVLGIFILAHHGPNCAVNAYRNYLPSAFTPGGFFTSRSWNDDLHLGKLLTSLTLEGGGRRGYLVSCWVFAIAAMRLRGTVG